MMRPIRYLGDPVLRGKTENVKSINQDIKLLVQSMFASMQKANGVGLAAPQVGVNLAIAVIDIPGHLPFAIINPKITKSSGKRIVENEGCLSVPGYRGNPQRSIEVHVEATNLDNKKIKFQATDNLLAQVLEHEIDHLNGTLYLDRIDDMSSVQKLNTMNWEEDD
ncbi:MAG: peptide deformylase [Chloroflexi bacterium]|nr:peptide deformylase [Chloroflexota bacterium]|tara:strand:+ start:4847 stop:5341 length:495 start_codon:yes stop_codon:yes gene_type:complete